MRPAAWSVLFAVTAVTSPARADDPDEGETPQVDKGGDREVSDVPELELVLWPQSRGLGGTEQRERWTIDLGGEARIDLTGLWWANDDDVKPGQVRLDSPARGWTTGVQLSRDLGFARFTVHGSVGQVDSEFGREQIRDAGSERGDVAVGRGRYREVGVSLRKTFRLSRTMNAWISLGLGHRAWSQDRKLTLREPDATELTLSIGTTF